MSNQYLKLRRSAVPGKIPETSSLDFGEIALNTYDGLLFIKKSGSLGGEQIVTIGDTTSNFTGSFTGSFKGNLTGQASQANTILINNASSDTNYAMVFTTAGSNGYLTPYTDAFSGSY